MRVSCKVGSREQLTNVLLLEEISLWECVFVAREVDPGRVSQEGASIS